MKQNNPMYKQFLDQYEHEWFECIAAFSRTVDDLNDVDEDEIEYNDIKKIFGILDYEEMILNDIKALKKKYPSLFKQYKQEKSKEDKQFKELWEKFSKDSDKPTEEIYELVVEAMSDYDKISVEKICINAWYPA